MTADRVQNLRKLVGKEVRTLRSWAGIEVGIKGVVGEVYDDGQAIMVAWEDRRVGRSEYARYKELIRVLIKRPTNWTQMLRDGFRGRELRFLEVLKE